MQVVATTTLSKSAIDRDFDDFLAESIIDYVPRRGRSLAKLASDHDADGIVVWENNGPVLHIGGEKVFFHPSMAKNRVTSFIRTGSIDPLVRACDLKADYSFLDCTLGLGADAIVAAFFASEGVIVGLESSELIAMIIKWGMKLYKSDTAWLDKAIKMIEVVKCDHLTYLSHLDDNTFDIVYFDPMFRQPIRASQPISPLRSLANHRPLEKRAVIEACRVAKKRVVMKEMFSSQEFARLGFTKVVGSPNNRIKMGVIDV